MREVKNAYKVYVLPKWKTRLGTACLITGKGREGRCNTKSRLWGE